MKKIVIILLALVMISGCTSKDENEKETSHKVTSTESLDDSFYPIVNMGTNLIREAFYKDFYSTNDMQTIGRELQVLSTEHFSTNEYYMSEGLQIIQGDKNKLLQRSYEETLQPKKGESVEGVLEPTMIENIHEQDYYKRDGNKYTLEGMSFALVLNTSVKVGEETHKFSEQTLNKYATDSIQKFYKFIQSKKDLKNIPVVVAVYLKNDSSINDYNGKFLYKAFCQKGNVGKISKLDYDTYIFSSEEALKADEATASQFSIFKNNMKNACTEAIGIVGYGRYRDNQIKSMKIQATVNVKSYTELIYIVESMADEMDQRFEGFDCYAVISDQEGVQAIIVKKTGEKSQSTLLY